MVKKIYKEGEYAYFIPKGEIVKIMGSTPKNGVFFKSHRLKVLSLKEIDPMTGSPKLYYECNPAALAPINDQDVQLFLKFHYNSQNIRTFRQL